MPMATTPLLAFMQLSNRAFKPLSTFRSLPFLFLLPLPFSFRVAILRNSQHLFASMQKSEAASTETNRAVAAALNAEIAAMPATTQSRWKSCFWKLPEIDEESRGKTVGRVKKKVESSVVEGKIQARKMFEREKVKSVCESNKKTVKQGRMVASRYNGGVDVRKRLLPEGGSEIRVKKRHLVFR